jgi:hypothetical protein
MTKSLFVRAAAAMGMTALAILFLGLIPFLDANPTSGASLTKTLPVSVDRTFKGDRLPLPSEANAALSRNEPLRGAYGRAATPQEVPFACDTSFSPISAPRLALIYGRCLS